MIEILAAGPLTTIQDLGRPGWATLGVARSGAFDRAAAALANRLVGNDPNAALLEVTLGGLAIRLADAATVALTGASCPGLDLNAAVSLPAGASVRLALPADGARSYLAVRGGIDVAPVLGSRSTDLLSGLGPARVRPGEVLAVGAEPGRAPAADPVHAVQRRNAVRVLPGPRVDWFADGAWDVLLRTEWTVLGESNRVGVRLDGPAVTRARTEELPSEPALPGAVQIPTDGRPIVFGPDAPVTGGYPVLAVAVEDDLGVLAQQRPGDRIRFEAIR
jgi:biotin-dependent carboxylase-like uncharacterized protein